MQIDLTSILTQAGKTEEFIGSLELDNFETRMGSYEIREKTPIEVLINHTGDQVLMLDASTQVFIEIPCGRCLKPVAVQFKIHANREIDMKMSAQERMEALEESNYIAGKILDVDQLMYNEILVRWPLQVLCEEDCKGICPNCGADLNQTSCDCDTAPRDPRMAAINDIFSKFKEV